MRENNKMTYKNYVTQNISKIRSMIDKNDVIWQYDVIPF